MKVLCLWYQPEDARSAPFMAPMQRTEKAFAKFGITMKLAHVKTPKESDKALAGAYDVLLLHGKPVYEPALKCGKPIIYLERIDGAQLRSSRQHMDSIIGVIKGYAFKDRSLYNTTWDRRHVDIMYESGMRAYHGKHLHKRKLPSPLVPEDKLDRIRVGYGFGSWKNMEGPAATEFSFETPRLTDANFVGSVGYDGTEVGVHRQAALKAAKTWHGPSVAESGRPWPLHRYHHSILRSKAVLCPWGWGESSHRDYEAMLLGAVMIKPDTDYVETWPNIYQAGKTYVVCKPDFSDAHDKIAHIAQHFDEYLPMRILARKLILDAWSDDAIAERMAGQIKELVECSPTKK